MIISKDRGKCRHRGNNDQRCRVRQYYIDEEVFRDASEKCDILLLNDEKREAYFIELKGQDIEKAIRQVEVTSSKLKEELSGYLFYYRIIYRTGSHGVQSSSTIKWKERMGRNMKNNKAYAVVKNMYYEEGI